MCNALHTYTYTLTNASNSVMNGWIKPDNTSMKTDSEGFFNITTRILNPAGQTADNLIYKLTVLMYIRDKVTTTV